MKANGESKLFTEVQRGVSNKNTSDFVGKMSKIINLPVFFEAMV